MVHSQRWYAEIVSLAGIHWAAVALSLITGLIHIYVGSVRGRPSLMVAGVGFFVGIGLFLGDYHRQRLYAVGIVYVLLQIILWAIFNAGEYTTIGYFDKIVQVTLVGLLGYLLLKTRNRTK